MAEEVATSLVRRTSPNPLPDEGVGDAGDVAASSSRKHSKKAGRRSRAAGGGGAKGGGAKQRASNNAREQRRSREKAEKQRKVQTLEATNRALADSIELRAIFHDGGGRGSDSRS